MYKNILRGGINLIFHQERNILNSLIYINTYIINLMQQARLFLVGVK